LKKLTPYLAVDFVFNPAVMPTGIKQGFSVKKNLHIVI